MTATTSSPSRNQGTILDRKHLVPGEKVLWEGRPSAAIVVLKPLVLLILAVVFAFIILTYSGQLELLVAALIVSGAMVPFDRRFGIITGVSGVIVALLVAIFGTSLELLVAIPVLLGIIPFVLTFLNWRNIVFATTNRRIISQYGLLSKSYVDMGLDRVQTISVKQPFFERLFGFGDVYITSSAAGGGFRRGAPSLRIASNGGVVWENVPKPFMVERTLNGIIYSPRTPTGEVGPAPPPSGGVEKAIGELSSMREKGMITEAEYQAKREEVLKRL